MKYLITGFKGQLGYDIARELDKREEHDYLALDIDDMDITNAKEVNEVVSKYNPDVIIHCAAWTQVDKAEEEMLKCYKVNVLGTKNMADASIKTGAKIIYISTDYVFDGTKEGIYEPDDIANPKSIYGLTKYLGEEEVRRNPNHFITRVSWVFGINGNNFIKTMLRLAETKTELNVVNDQIGSPTYTVDLSRVLVDMANSNAYGTYHVTNEDYCSWAEFAEYIMSSNNKDMKINGISSEQYPQRAYRPRNSKMSKDKLVENGFQKLPTWKNAVDRYNEELKEKVR